MNWRVFAQGHANLRCTVSDLVCVLPKQALYLLLKRCRFQSTDCFPDLHVSELSDFIKMDDREK